MEIKIQDLPEVSKSRLLAALKEPPQGTFVFNESKRGWAFAGIVAAVLGLSWVFSQADNYKWQSEERLNYLFFVLAICIIGWESVAYLVGWARNDFKAHVLINPLYFLRFRFSRIEAISLTPQKIWSIRNLQDRQGAYAGTRFYFKSQTGQQVLKIKSIHIANDLFDALNRFPGYVSDLIQRQDSSTLYSFDPLYEWRAREEQFPRGHAHPPTGLAFVVQYYQLKRRLRPVLLAGLFGVVIFFAAFVPYNDYRDDELRWNTASSSSSASAYRLYLASRPDGHHLSEAHTAIARLYDSAAQNYRSSSGFATSEGSEAVIRILEYAKSTDHYKVFVAFSGDNEIPANIEERVRSVTGLSQIIPIMPSFTAPMNQAREARILERISSSFGKVIPGDILQFVAGRASLQGVGFVVTYVIRASGDLYYPVKQEHLAEAKRDWYTGIQFEWNFDITVQGMQSSTFQLGLQSEPAQLFNVAYAREVSEGAELPPMKVYDAMADSAFDDFGSKLLSELAVR